MAEEIAVAVLRGLTWSVAIISGGLAVAMAWSGLAEWRERKRIERIVRSMERRQDGGD